MPDNAILILEDQIVEALRRISRAIDLRSRMLLHDYQLTAPQLLTLKTIARLQPVTPGTVAREVHLGQPTITGVLNRLERRGLICRSRGDVDRRSVLVRLTEEGERVLRDAPSLLESRFQRELARLKPWERTQMLATLQRIADMMGSAEVTASLETNGGFAETPVDGPQAGITATHDEEEHDVE